MATAAELLAQVDTAITGLLTGAIQSYRLPSGREVTKLQLDELRAFRKELLAQKVQEEAAASGGGFYTLAGYRGEA